MYRLSTRIAREVYEIKVEKYVLTCDDKTYFDSILLCPDVAKNLEMFLRSSGTCVLCEKRFQLSSLAKPFYFTIYFDGKQFDALALDIEVQVQKYLDSLI